MSNGEQTTAQQDRAQQDRVQHDVERHFVRAACAIMLGAGLFSLSQLFVGIRALSGVDLQYIGLSLAALVLNLRSWRYFARYITGNSDAFRNFALRKIISLALVVTLLFLGGIRGLAIFAVCMVLFLLGGAMLSIMNGR